MLNYLAPSANNSAIPRYLRIKPMEIIYKCSHKIETYTRVWGHYVYVNMYILSETEGNKRGTWNIN